MVTRRLVTRLGPKVQTYKCFIDLIPFLFFFYIVILSINIDYASFPVFQNFKMVAPLKNYLGTIKMYTKASNIIMPFFA